MTERFSYGADSQRDIALRWWRDFKLSVSELSHPSPTTTFMPGSLAEALFVRSATRPIILGYIVLKCRWEQSPLKSSKMTLTVLKRERRRELHSGSL